MKKKIWFNSILTVKFKLNPISTLNFTESENVKEESHVHYTHLMKSMFGI